MSDKKLICPVKRINKSTVDFKVDLRDDNMNIKVDISTKNIIKSVTDFIMSKINKGDKNE